MSDSDKTNLMSTTAAALPVMAGSFDDNTDDGRDRLIQGTILACVDGLWAARDESELPETFIVVGTAKAVQHWRDGKPVPGDTFTTRPLPDVEYLNSQIPIETWEEGLDGKPRPPWTLQHVAYLFDDETGAIYTFINSTAGAAMAVRELREQVQMMRNVRGATIVPVIALASKPMKTAFGVKQRPAFKVLEWRDLGGGPAQATPLASAPIAPPAKPVAAIEHIGSAVEPVSFREELDDELPFITADNRDGWQRRWGVAFVV